MPGLLRKLLWVLAFSLAVHLALLFGPRFSLALRPDAPPVLEARLAPAPPARPEPVKPAKPRPERPRPLPLPVAETAAFPAEAAATPDATAQTQAPEAAIPLPAAPVEPAPPPAAPSMPRRVAIKFTVYKGLDGFNVGRAEQSWQLDGEHYTISSVAEATGVFSLFASGKHVQVSRGDVGSDGLRPSSYRVERGQGADKTDTARFDWGAMTLALASGSDKRTLKLPEGTQDLLSFIYQLAFAPPQHSVVQLTITNGRKLDSYAYWVVEEALDTPMGRLKTLHLGKQREEGEKDTEVWLAADYHYLPVKISQVDKDGDGLVLLANEIAITQ